MVDPASIAPDKSLSSNPLGDYPSFLEKMRTLDKSRSEDGTIFEIFIKKYLAHYSPVHRNIVKEVWRWKDWARDREINRTDTGIDLVMEGVDGDFWAIQCKFFDTANRLQKGDIDSFFTASGKSYNGHVFSKRLIVSTASAWSKNAEEAMEGQDPPCTRFDFRDQFFEFKEDFKRALEAIGKGDTKAPRREYKTLRDHQVEAVKAVCEGFEGSDRGKLIMACGTGKTFTSLKIAEQMLPEGGHVLYLAPSLTLLSQTLLEWISETPEERPIHPYVVCSDAGVSRDSEDMRAHELILPATTDSQKLAHRLGASREDMKTHMVFATYQSIEVISRAQREFGAPDFDLVVCDEAHRTTGVEGSTRKKETSEKKVEGNTKKNEFSTFIQIHDDRHVRVKKRLYMTATPRLYTESAKSTAKARSVEIFSMDDPQKYGEDFHRLGFAKSVEDELLADYKVLILTQQRSTTGNLDGGDSARSSIDDLTKIYGCYNALAGRTAGDSRIDGMGVIPPMSRAVMFARKIKHSRDITRWFSEHANDYHDPDPNSAGSQVRMNYEIRHVDGTQNSRDRNNALHWLGEDPSIGENDRGSHTCRILSNVRCLSEGIDVPSLDAVIFMAPRRSKVEVVQAVGRVMRIAPGKKYGYIIIPVVIDRRDTPEETLDKSDFSSVWEILQALRCHDDRLDMEINKLVPNSKGDRIQIIDTQEHAAEQSDRQVQEFLDSKEFSHDELRNTLLAKIVEKCGDRRYWETWAKDVAEIASYHVEQVQRLTKENPQGFKWLFDGFLGDLHKDINEDISKEEAQEMLAQHIITQPVFNALFEGYEFTSHNPIAITMEKMARIMDDLDEENKRGKLADFYKSVQSRVTGIKDDTGKQKIITELYETFFQTAFPSMAERMGVVYTPTEVVDFILHSVEGLLEREFRKSLSDKGVHILDPFTGTGTFLTRLLHSGLIRDEDLEYKYKHELHVNELILLAYYIATVNIELSYRDRIKGLSADGEVEDVEFPGSVLTDTFQIRQSEGGRYGDLGLLTRPAVANSERVDRQRKSPITIVIGNPPYSSGQRSANDDNANKEYPQLDKKIRDTYAKHSKATSKISLYDSYIRAFRWASDRIEQDGIIGYVTNGGYIDGMAMDGFRKCLRDEFTSIYCLNLRGNTRLAGELVKREGGKIFGQGSRASIAIIFLVKNKSRKKQGCEIFYHDIGDYLTAETKLEKLTTFREINNVGWEEISPDKHHSWINQQNPLFDSFLPLGVKGNKSKGPVVSSVFKTYSRGTATARDTWVYNFSRATLEENMRSMVRFFNEQVRKRVEVGGNEEKDRIDRDSSQIKWSDGLMGQVAKGRELDFDAGAIRQGMYRPFTCKWVFFDKKLIERTYLQPSFFPNPESRNFAICVSGIGASKGFSSLMVNKVPNLDFLEKTQCFPRYTFSKSLNEEGFDRVDNIPAETVERFRKHYGITDLDGDAIFYYAYSILHHPKYRELFSSDLKKGLPRIPLSGKGDDFEELSALGKSLAALHLDYEKVAPANLQVEGDEKNARVEKMRFGRGEKREKDKSVIHYNPTVTLRNIPLKAYDYVVNGKPAIEWVMERYQVTTDKDSGLRNDPNEWGGGSYILDLLKRIVTVSLETVRLTEEIGKKDLDIGK